MGELKEIENRSTKLILTYLEKINTVLSSEISEHSKLQAIFNLSKNGLYYSNDEINKGVSLPSAV